MRIWEGIEHRAWSERIEDRRQMSEIGCLRSAAKLISDLRLLTSVKDGFYDFNDLNEFNDQ